MESIPRNPMDRVVRLEQEHRKLKKAYGRLAEKEREQRHFIQNTRDAIVIFDHELLLLHANPAALRLLGLPPRPRAKEVGIESVFAQPDVLDDLLRQLLAKGAVDHFETTLCGTRSGREQPVVIGSGFTHLNRRGRIKHLEFILTDITERKKMEQRIQQSQKFEAIGTLAGGVAHDFNNLLMGIQGRVDLISLDLSSSNPHAEHLEAIEDYIQSGAGLTRQLLGFARGGKYDVRPVNLNELVQKSSTMFGRTRKEIQIHTRFTGEAPVVEADFGQIEQVLLNMYVNAWQAMPGGGDLYLETALTALDESFCRPHRVRPGGYGRISVTDTGVGMDAATLQRIFDPFFTTREKSRGTGLGLASAYGIVKNHGGLITVYSEVGRGSDFNIYLPLSEKVVYCEASFPECRIEPGSETILLVDDEDLIIEVTTAMLKRIGYRVIAAGSGEKAVETLKAEGHAIDLVILDLIMPGMDGVAAYDRISEIRPDLPVILSSGYAMNGQAKALMDKGCRAFLQKPFSFPTLSEVLRDMLGRPPIAGGGPGHGAMPGPIDRIG